MKLLVVALLAAISYAQTDCEDQIQEQPTFTVSEDITHTAGLQGASMDGFAFQAEHSGTANAIDLALWGKEHHQDNWEYYDSYWFISGVSFHIAIYEGQGFGTLMTNIFISQVQALTEEDATLTTYYFDETISLTKEQWYTVGLYINDGGDYGISGGYMRADNIDAGHIWYHDGAMVQSTTGFAFPYRITICAIEELFSFSDDCSTRDSCVGSPGYPDGYAKRDYCKVTILTDVEIFVSFPFLTYDDAVTVKGVAISSADAFPSVLFAGDIIEWTATHSANQAGWEICLREPLSPISPPTLAPIGPTFAPTISVPTVAPTGNDFTMNSDDCEIDLQGCVTDGEGKYTDGISCTFTANYDGFLYFPEFDINDDVYYYEGCPHDEIQIGSFDYCGIRKQFQYNDDPDGTFVTAGEEIKFITSDGKKSANGVGEGFTVCLVKKETQFSFQHMQTDQCEIDANGCVSDRTGDYSPFDSCTIQIHHDGVLQFEYFNTEINSDDSDGTNPCIDDLVIGGVEYCSEDGTYGSTGNPNGIAVTVGDEISWAASKYTQNKGWKICLVTAHTHFTIESDTGDCEIDADGCVTDGSNEERDSCTINIHRDGTLDFQLFDTEINTNDNDGSDPCIDDLVIQGVEYCSQSGIFGATGDPNGIGVTAGEQIDWSVGDNSQGAGFKICLVPTTEVVDCTLPSDVQNSILWNCNSVECSNPVLDDCDATDANGVVYDTSLYSRSDATSVTSGGCTTTNTEVQVTCTATYFIQNQKTNACSTGFVLIEDEATCEAAANALGEHYDGVKSKSNRPYGCISKTGQNGDIYFNTDTTNPIYWAQAPICTPIVSLDSQVETEIGASISIITSLEIYHLLALIGVLYAAYSIFSKCFQEKEYATIEEPQNETQC